jgi:long-chain acyl-CoA synthetase
MNTDSKFSWHPSSRLFAGHHEITRPKALIAGGFEAICDSTVSGTLGQLGTLLGTGRGFCVHTHPLADNVVAPDNQFLTFTGGSTGAPKAIRRTQASWTASFFVNHEMFQFRQHDTVAVLGHLSHSLSLYGVLEGLHLGLDVSVLAGLRPPAQRTELCASDATILYATPTQLRLLATAFSKPLTNLRLILCGGGHLDESTMQNVMQLCPNADLRVFYGAAETSFITVSDATTPNGFVGKPYPNVTLEVRAPDGEIWVKSPYLAEEYADLRLTRDMLGFVSVGELGQMVPNGNLKILGRKNRIVTIADQNVHLENVERVIGLCKDVVACAVLAVPDLTRGSKLVAVVEGNPDATTEEQIKRHCRDLLEAIAIPKSIRFLEHLPLLNSGKPDLAGLTRWLELNE